MWIPTITVLTAPILLAVGLLSRILLKQNNFFADNGFLLAFVPIFFFAFQNSEAIAFIFFIFSFILLFFISKNKKTRWILYLFVAFIFSFVLYQHYITELAITNPISSIFLPNYSSSTEIIPFSSRFIWIFEINLTLILDILLVLGIAVSLLSNQKKNLFVISIFSLALFLYLFPESFAYRFYRELTVIMAFVMAIGVWRIFIALSDFRKKYSSYYFFCLTNYFITT